MTVWRSAGGTPPCAKPDGTTPPESSALRSRRCGTSSRSRRSRDKLGLPPVTMRQLVGSATPDDEDEAEQARIAAIRESFPDHVELVRDGWLAPNPRGWRWVRNYFARRLQSVRVWGFAIVVLIGSTSRFSCARWSESSSERASF